MCSTLPTIPCRKVSIQREKANQTPENNVIFEKALFEVLDESFGKVHWVSHRPIAPNVLNVNISFSVFEPVNEFWVRGILYYKYTTYQKFLVDVTIEICAFLNGTIGNSVGDIIMQNYFKYKKNIHLSYKMLCPFNGTLNTIISPMNVSELTIPLLPAGRYHFDVHIPIYKNSSDKIVIRYFFTISDLRVWF